MTTTTLVAGDDEPNATLEAVPADDDGWQEWRSRIAAAKRRRDDRVDDWRVNVNRRRGGNEYSTSASSKRRVNLDWSLTKAKIAQLYSQTPEVRLSPRADKYRAAVPVYGRQLNDVISDCDVGPTIEEVLSDVVNASGIGGILVNYEARTEPREVPTEDLSTLPPELQQAHAAGLYQLETQTVDYVVECQYLCDRISPTDLLVPSDFTGSQYNRARWLGNNGRLTWTQAQRQLGLKDDVKEKVLGRDKRNSGNNQSLNSDTLKFKDGDVVNYTQVFYWRHYYHPEETNFKALQRLVFVDGLDEPVINEGYRGQKRLPDGRLVGVLRNPINVCTLTYISDDCYPPSDSTVSRWQVEELEDSRDAMVEQRRHSIPIRWYDTNRIGPNTKTLLDKGTWQQFIPTNGDGSRAIGEVARANYPQERFEFDSVIKNDLTEMWQVGTNQAGAFSGGSGRTASEAKIIQQNFQTRVGQERDKVTRFFVGIAECLAGLLALYGEFDIASDEDAQRLDTVTREELAQGYTYSVRVDSTVLLDANQRIQQLSEALNLTGQSGHVNPKEPVSEIWELSGMDPAKVMVEPQPKPPDPVNISINSAEDMVNPVMLASLGRTQQMPSPDDVKAALQLLQSVGQKALVGMPPENAQQAAMLQDAPGPPQGAPPPGGPPGSPEAPPQLPPGGVETPGIANPEWEAAPRIDRRDVDTGAPK